jgi:FHS family L-fucose permease-like MFS transporter
MQQNATLSSSRSALIPILILGVFYFIFGFVTWLNATLITYLKIACELNYFQSLFVAFAFYISYFFMAIPCSLILKKTGFKNGMILGLIIMACGALLFIPAALSRTYGVFLFGLFVLGIGLTILQTAANPYVTILGPIESAARRISIMGICNKVAGFIAPIVLAAIVLSDADVIQQQLKLLDVPHRQALLDSLAARAVKPYGIMAIVLAGLALLVRFSPLPKVEMEQETDLAANIIREKARANVFQFPNLVLGVIALFFYVGAEVISVDTISGYGNSLGIPLSHSRFFPSVTLAAMVLGYIIGIFTIPKYLSQPKALALSAIAGLAFSVLALIMHGNLTESFPLSVSFIALLGLANALIWPAIWPLAIHGLGRFTKIGSALLIMSIAGGALLPLLYGRLADMPSIGTQNAYVILLPCYLIILYYAVKGYRLR